MSEISQPQTWHYGLVARYWAEFNEGGDDIDYYRQFIEENGEPALDLACGAGRVLLPLLRAGLDVDGCDISADMLAYARQKAEIEGLSPRLYRQAMHELDLPRRYRTILIPGSFGLGGDRRLDREALRRVYDHLEPGGLLVFDHDPAYNDRDGWLLWLREEREKLPGPWPNRQPRPMADGGELVMKIRTVDINPLEQLMFLEARLELWRDGQLEEAEEYPLRGCLYFKPELVLMLECVGFEAVHVYGAYRREGATPEDNNLVFVARKAGSGTASTA
ncbi:MAG: class I SAM-dependent methyltransferase [Chloroflexi bacterium]|nr:class I SAM-dependent methyltransferase [Chloroflexota bacterium]MCI0731004.1 class I SAM-dependent methyltransferase [Chloroflexota bacterium]